MKKKIEYLIEIIIVVLLISSALIFVKACCDTYAPEEHNLTAFQ